MRSIPLIAVAVITNGESSNLQRINAAWIGEGFSPGRTLFFCGPVKALLDQGISAGAIIDYIDPLYYRNNFHINHKKHAACQAIAAKYIFLVHDRFLAKKGLSDVLHRRLADEEIDFGAVNVDNEDGSPALRELRLRSAAVLVDLEPALVPTGRLTCAADWPGASNCIAVNGGQFFLKKSMTSYLERPMRWVEMEDDVLSHDLRTAHGSWIHESGLITLVPRLAPNFHYSWCTRTKYQAYRIFCNICAALAGCRSVGHQINSRQMDQLLATDFFLIDPLHKVFASDFLPSSLEKLMARARISSGGISFAGIEKCRLGWKIACARNNNVS